MLIVLFGKKKSGKDTLGDMMARRYGFRTDSFAAPLKKMASLAFPQLREEDLYGESEKRETPYPQYTFGGKCLRCAGEKFTHTKEDPHLLSCKTILSCKKCGMEYTTALTPRLILQTLGTEWGRRLCEDVWSDAAIHRFEHEKAPTVITDGRFPNELARCKERGAHCVLLLRRLDDHTGDHESETAIKTIPREAFSYILDNRCALEDMPELLDDMMADLRD